MGRVIQGRALVAGEAQGTALVSHEPLSFWGGYDYHTGEIIDRRHPLAGQKAAGRVLAIPCTRGSSTTTAVLLEAIRARTSPVAILTSGVDAFCALGAIVADELYQTPIPIIALSADDFALLQSGQWVWVQRTGMIELNSRG